MKDQPDHVPQASWKKQACVRLLNVRLWSIDDQSRNRCKHPAAVPFLTVERGRECILLTACVNTFRVVSHAGITLRERNLLQHNDEAILTFFRPRKAPRIESANGRSFD